MPQMSTTRRVHHAASEMFDLVADVERYPEFVPLCQSLRVRERRTETDREIIVADMTVAYKLLRETFASRVTLERPKLRFWWSIWKVRFAVSTIAGISARSRSRFATWSSSSRTNFAAGRLRF